MSDETTQTPDEKGPHEIDWDSCRMSAEELKQFVMDFCAGHIFTHHCLKGKEHLTPMVFMPLGFLDRPYSNESVEQVGLLWERYDRAGPRAINGLPCFMSVNFMHKDDWKRACTAIEKELKRRDEIEV